MGFRPLAGLSCINRLYVQRGKMGGSKFPSPRGVELHKPLHEVFYSYETEVCSFRPLAGLSCINPNGVAIVIATYGLFPSPRGVELHKPYSIHSS